MAAPSFIESSFTSKVEYEASLKFAPSGMDSLGPASVLETTSGEKLEAGVALAGKVVALYFSAHWCPPCKVFTPKLAAAYEMANEDDANFQIVFVSSDNDEAGMVEYMSAMHGPWLRVPFDSPLRKALKLKHGCFAGKTDATGKIVDEPAAGAVRRSGIPSLVVVGRNGEECVFDGKDAIATSGPHAIGTWRQYAW